MQCTHFVHNVHDTVHGTLQTVARIVYLVYNVRYHTQWRVLTTCYVLSLCSYFYKQQGCRPCTLYSVHFALDTVRYTLYTVNYILYIKHYTLWYIVHRKTLYTILCSSWFRYLANKIFTEQSTLSFKSDSGKSQDERLIK